MRSRIPLVLAGLLIAALIATVGLAAFSPTGSDSTPDTTEVATLDMELPISGRVASAVFALAVAPVRDAEIATSTTIEVDETPAAPEADTESTAATEAAVTTTETPTTEAPTTTTQSPAPAAAKATTTTAAPKSDTTPPAIQIVSPKDGATVTSKIIEFKGVTERGAAVFSGPYEANVDDDGNWSLSLVLAPGENGAKFTARDAAGNEATARIVVTYDPPASTTTTTRAPSTTTTTKPPSTTTTTKAPSSGYSPLWPADAGGRRSVEAWRADVEKHWDAGKVECVLGIIGLESHGDPTAHNTRTGAVGLMQHLLKYWPSRARGAGFVDGDGLVASPFNGEANIAAGAYLASYYERVGKDWRSPWTVWRSVPACQS